MFDLYTCELLDALDYCIRRLERQQMNDNKYVEAKANLMQFGLGGISSDDRDAIKAAMKSYQNRLMYSSIII